MAVGMLADAPMVLSFVTVVNAWRPAHGHEPAFHAYTATKPIMNNVTIYHNPACGTSRNVLALIRHAGIEPTIVEYLKTPPSKDQLRALVAATGQPLRSLLREKGTPYAELGIDDPTWTDEQLLDFVGQHPILMNRPVVVTPLGTRLCRPSEAVLDILPSRPLSSSKSGRG